MISPVLLVVWSLVFSLQTPPATLHRVGPTAAHLSADDVAQITRIASDAGGQPWVIVGRQLPLLPPSDMLWFVDVYFAPSQSGEHVRRGRAMTLTSRIPSRGDFGTTRTWSPATMGEPFFDWAQVPEPGRHADDVTSSRDINRPFRVIGAISDDALIGAMAAVRLSPALPLPAGWPPGQPISEHALRVAGAWPIALVMAEGDGVGVHLRVGENESGGQRVLVRERNGQWEVALAGFFTHAE